MELAGVFYQQTHSTVKTAVALIEKSGIDDGEKENPTRLRFWCSIH